MAQWMKRAFALGMAQWMKRAPALGMAQWMKRAFALAMAACCLFAFCGCQSTAQNTAAGEETEKTVVFTDDLGREVEVPEHITRVVPSGSLAQIYLYAVAPDSLIGAAGAWSADAGEYIEEKYLALPGIGQLFGGSNDLNYEEITKLDPQLIIDVGDKKEYLADEMEEVTLKTGIPVVHITMTAATMAGSFEKLGKLLGEEEQGNRLRDYCVEKYQNAVEMMERVDADNARKSVLYSTGENGLSVVAKDSYHSEIIDLLSDNLAVVDNPSGRGTGNEIDMEQMLLWDPQVIIFAPDGYYDYVSGDSQWAFLQAVKNGNYYEVPNGPYNWMGFPPSSNRMLGLVWMSQLLYPEYADYDMEEEAKEYYRLFYHSDLSTEQYQALVKNSILKEQVQDNE